ncbi:hypothetical protein C4577_05595 [Candidatus Parcubacteria bacterium]|nr:MAG: hypothetical protein C4577_05595 [Candidatus Parcubacteria bacterium]
MGRVELVISKIKEPIAKKFTKPKGRKGSLKSGGIEEITIKGYAHNLCPATRDYLNGLTTDALNTFREVLQIEDVCDPVEAPHTLQA